MDIKPIKYGDMEAQIFIGLLAEVPVLPGYLSDKLMK
jgi:hypothetical protein